jgi:glutaredoxin 3
MGIFSSKPTTDPSKMSSAKAKVDQLIKGNRVMIFSKSYCPYCAKAKRAVATVLPKEKFTVLEIENDPEVNAIQDYLASITGGRSVPRVFIDGVFIGGGDDLDALARSGKLEVMVKEKGIL